MMKIIKQKLLLMLLAVLVCANFASALSIYTNGTGDQLWDTTGNWDGGVPAAGSGATLVYLPGVDCIIDSTTTAVTDNMYIGGLYGGGGAGQILMTGGSLTSANISIGYELDGLFAMSNGSAYITGGTVVGELAPGGSGVLEITGGTFSTFNMLIPYLGEGLVKLYGGTLEIRWEQGSAFMIEYYTSAGGGSGRMDIRGDGKLTWVGDHVADLIYQGEGGKIYTSQPGGVLKITYDDVNDLTTMKLRGLPTCSAVWEAGLGLDWDLSEDCYITFEDFCMLAEQWLTTPSGYNTVDLAGLTDDWLRCNNPTDANNCEEPTASFEIYVEDYGAIGDGIVDDTNSFYAAAQAIEEFGGGTLYLTAGKTYRVGRQTHEEWEYPYYQVQPIIQIDGCPYKVRIIGNGATMKANDGLRFGSFDPTTGEPYYPTLPFTDYDYIANAYWGMVQVSNCADVEIRDLNLDGNINNLVLGGLWGDTGRQCAAYGIWSHKNDKLSVYDVNSSYHGLDGLSAAYSDLTASDPNTPVYLENVECYYNARQGLSWVGGIELTAVDCKFNHTGKERFCSSPGAGVDVEAEGSVCRDGKFINCEFVNNTGVGVIADSGDSADCDFNGCLIWGTTNWSIWPRKPGFSFNGCDIYGAVVNTYGSSDANEATQFVNCDFEDVQGQAYPTYGSSAILECWGENVTFDGCTIVANEIRALYLDDTGSTEIVKNCHIYHKYDGLGTGGFQSLLRGTYLENTEFHETLTSGSYYINLDSVTVGSGVVVDGPRCKWQSTSGLTGTIPPGSY